MIGLTKKDAIEIHFALASKIELLGDPQFYHQDIWTGRRRQHLRELIERIGPSGKNLVGLTPEGAARIAELERLLTMNLADFELVNHSGLWQGHPFSHAVRMTREALGVSNDGNVREAPQGHNRPVTG